MAELKAGDAIPDLQPFDALRAMGIIIDDGDLDLLFMKIEELI
mgnify:CR=1|jgi:hypothetical protein|tara:strand:+ start:376 stop:504 length:129 start_codon:yes stop_codon:yes gene_type:complete